MGSKDLETIERIKTATREILDECGDAESITVRQIAQRAGVGVGLINYHFGSKGRLLQQIVTERIEQLAQELADRREPGLSPERKLSGMMKTLFTFGAEYKTLMQVLIRESFESGNMDAAMAIVPLLRDILGPEADEMRLRIMALQILQPIQVSCLAPEKLNLYCGINLENAAQRDKFVDSLIGNLI